MLGLVARPPVREYLCRQPNYGSPGPDLGFQRLPNVVLELRLVQLGCPVQAGEVEEVVSTFFVSAPKALVGIGRAPSATPQRRKYTTVYE